MKNVTIWMSSLAILAVLSATPASANLPKANCATVNLTYENYKDECASICKNQGGVNTYEAGTDGLRVCGNPFYDNTTGSQCVCEK